MNFPFIMILLLLFLVFFVSVSSAFFIRILPSAFFHPHFSIRIRHFPPSSAIRHPPPSGQHFTHAQNILHVKTSHSFVDESDVNIFRGKPKLTSALYWVPHVRT